MFISCRRCQCSHRYPYFDGSISRSNVSRFDSFTFGVDPNDRTGISLIIGAFRTRRKCLPPLMIYSNAKQGCVYYLFLIWNNQVGQVLASYISGVIMHFYSWETAFYAFGLATSVWFISFVSGILSSSNIKNNRKYCGLQVIFCYSNPASHPFISAGEKEYLMRELGQLEQNEHKQPTPWRDILTSKPVWALILSYVSRPSCNHFLTVQFHHLLFQALRWLVKLCGVNHAAQIHERRPPVEHSRYWHFHVTSMDCKNIDVVPGRIPDRQMHRQRQDFSDECTKNCRYSR